MSPEGEFRVLDISKLDRKALEPRLQSLGARFEEPTRSATGQHELATLALVGGVAVVSSAAAYLFGKRKRRQMVLRAEAKGPDGTWRRVELLLDEDSVEPVESQVMKQLKTVLGAS